MTRKFSVGASAMSKEQEQAFINYLREQNVAWWHWIKGMWLIVDKRDELRAKNIRDTLKKIVPGARTMVIEINEKTSWAGSGPKLEGKNMFRWMREVWSKPEDENG